MGKLIPFPFKPRAYARAMAQLPEFQKYNEAELELRAFLRQHAKPRSDKPRFVAPNGVD